MTALYCDVHRDDLPGTQRQRMPGQSQDEVLYADDTICVTQTAAAMNRLLRAIETEGLRYGLNLNKSKCECLAFGTNPRIRFVDGTRLQAQAEVQYLGCKLNDHSDYGIEISKRISAVMTTLNRLHMFFTQSDNTVA